jgi:preprotein translocase SecE subunit
MEKIKERVKEYYNISKAFLKEVWIETAPPGGKVSWPTKKMIAGSTLVVVVVVLIFALYLAIVDYISLNIMMVLIK